MARTRIAAAVLLTRGRGTELELFVAKRAAELSFFGGYWAFLGGVVDAADHDGEPDEVAALMRCAWREVFEEAGVLPAALAQRLGRAERIRLRGALVERGPAAAAAAREFRAHLDACPGLLAPGSAEAPKVIGRLTTPPFAPVLYRTLFLCIELPAGESASILPGELVQGEFIRAKDAMAQWLSGERLIAPPAVYFLDQLAKLPEAEAWERLGAACEACASGQLHEIRNVPGIWMIPLATETLPPATTTNAYWVGHERAYLVDPASFDTGEQARLFQFIDARLAEGLRLEGVIASHHHLDHVGAIMPVAERYGVPVLAHAETLTRLPAGRAELRELGDGDRLDLGAAPDAGCAPWELEVHHTPGHDRGHLVLVESCYRAVLAGDLCSTLSTIVIDPPEGHLGTYLNSLERMLEVPMGVLHPAHGPAHPDGHTLIRSYLDHRREREETLYGLLDRAPRDVSELARGVYTDVDPRLLGLAERSLLAGLEKLAEEGRAKQRGGGWVRA